MCVSVCPLTRVQCLQRSEDGIQTHATTVIVAIYQTQVLGLELFALQEQQARSQLSSPPDMLTFNYSLIHGCKPLWTL